MPWALVLLILFLIVVNNSWLFWSLLTVVVAFVVAACISGMKQEKNNVTSSKPSGGTPRYTPTQAPPLTGGVYLLKAGPHYKIGKAVEFDKRIKQLKIQLPFAVEIVHKIYARNPSAAETFWHRRFARKRVNGEWFTLSDEDVAEFKNTSRM